MTFVPSKASLALAPLLAALSLTPTLAHTGVHMAGGLSSGFLHPLTGPDHLVAMVAVGLWGAQLGRPAIWVLPITFPLVMALGGIIGTSGVELPAVELIIAFSGLALGALVALNVRPALGIAAALVALFAIFHGYAHGRELPEAADPVAYAVGFVTATGLLHLGGILIGALITRPGGAMAVRACGALIGCVGLYFILATMGVTG
ncbi:HupE/UreJ family protein [Terrihabitans sp. B22-R8]|uniref:HupE/UreJ family protein n=1 Tax=Terrihabitans sp. B22-R8 TaxID=3425128 RepID=UPI00403CEB04